MKRSIAFLLSIVMLLSLAACGSMRESAQRVVEKAIQAVQKLDTEQMQKYWGTSSVSTGSDETSDLDVECVKAMLKNLTYEIVSSDEKDDTATVKVNFSNIDIAKALTDTIAALLPQVIASSLTGEEVDDSLFNSELLKNLFFPKAPLHDGAVVVRQGKIVAAGCMLPMSESMNLSKDLGMRHRAGLGMSERSDAVVAIVSEETGAISVAIRGNLRRHLSPETLGRVLRNELLPREQEPSKLRKKTGWLWQGR